MASFNMGWQLLQSVRRSLMAKDGQITIDLAGLVEKWLKKNKDMILPDAPLSHDVRPHSREEDTREHRREAIQQRLRLVKPGDTE